MNNKPKIILCPYCGNTQTTPDRCDECGGRFASRALRVTQIGMGPWYIRDKAMPFRPGCSYETLSKLIESGKVKGTTVLRGPTTRQYWSLARNIPGVAHLVGYCHRCSAHVGPDDVACHDCATMFLPVVERNELGLQYPTNESAEKARQKIENDKAKRRLEVEAITAERADKSSQEGTAGQIAVDTGSSSVDVEITDDVIVVAVERDEPDIETEPTPDVSADRSGKDLIGTRDSGDDRLQPIDIPPSYDNSQGDDLVTIESQPVYGPGVERSAPAPEAAPPAAFARQGVPVTPASRTPVMMWALVGIIGLLTASLIFVVVENTRYARQFQADAVRFSAYQDRYPQPQATRTKMADPNRFGNHDPNAANGMAQVASLFEQSDYLGWSEPLAAEVAEAEALARIGRPHEALIKLKEIEMSMHPADRPEAIDRAIGQLEQHVSAIEVPTFFGIPVE